MMVRLGIVGTGHMASTYARTAAETPGVVVSAVVSRDIDRARAFAQMFDIGVAVDELEQVLGQVDALYVSTEPDRHAGAVRAALIAECPVLVEKPLTIDPAETQALFDLAATHDTLLIEAIWTLLLPAYRALNLQARSPERLHFDFSIPVSASQMPKLFLPDAGGVLLDRAVYGLAAAIDLLGPVETIWQDVKRDISGVDTDAVLLLRHQGGGQSLVTLSFDVQGPNRFDLACTDGSLSLGPTSLVPEVLTATAAKQALLGDTFGRHGLKERLKQSQTLRAIKRFWNGQSTQTFAYGTHPYGHMLQHFVDLVRAGERQSDVVTPAMSCRIAEIVAEARRD